MYIYFLGPVLGYTTIHSTFPCAPDCYPSGIILTCLLDAAYQFSSGYFVIGNKILIKICEYKKSTSQIQHIHNLLHVFII